MIKLTKTELRDQQVKLTQLRKYLPTLQLKKAMLQLEVNLVSQEIEEFTNLMEVAEEGVKKYALLFSDRAATDLFSLVKVKETLKEYENIAGVEIPVFKDVIFEEENYFLFDAPVWLEAASGGVKKLLVLKEKINVAKEKKRALEKELREVSIRVNLFEKIMIPRAVENIKKIKIFLGDQQLAAVSQAKIAKKKMMQR